MCRSQADLQVWSRSSIQKVRPCREVLEVVIYAVAIAMVAVILGDW
jgi:hypothetical protein